MFSDAKRLLQHYVPEAVISFHRLCWSDGGPLSYDFEPRLIMAARRNFRNTGARPLIEMMKPWLERELGRVPPAGPLADAIRYALARWPALTRFLDDGRIELDNNTVERAIRPVGRLFAGSDGGAARWAIVASLLATAKPNDVEPFAYLKQVLERMSNGHPMSRLDELLPRNWIPSNAKT